jgi:hypothetical protein
MVQRPPANRNNRLPARPVSRALPNRQRRSIGTRKGARRAAAQRQNAFLPPEDWHEPEGVGSTDYQIVVQHPGDGYDHVVTPEQVRRRLNQLPKKMVERLEVVQFSRMTSKKKSFPCYGMQWGSAIYLYPLETGLIEYFDRPPRPAEYHDARQYGGQWVQEGRSWKLVWTPACIADYYLNNVLIHELGHLLDDRNSSFRDRERYAEWFAIEHGLKPSRRKRA